MCIWISSKEAIEALAITKQAFHKARAAGKFRSRLSNDNGGIQYEVLLTDLPQPAQAQYWQSKNGQAGLQEIQVSDDEIYSTAPEYARRKADKYLALIKQSEGLSGDALKAFVCRHNTANPDECTSYPRLLDARKRYRAQGIAALLGQWGKRSGSSTVSDDLFSLFKSLYLKESRPSALSCWKITLGKAKENGTDISNFPSHTAFVRRVQKEVPEQSIYTARFGPAAANRKYGFYIKRNYDDTLAGECWVSDHAQIDIAVLYSDKGRDKVCFPWLTAWRDFKSGKFVGWTLHPDGPNSDHVFMSFYRAAGAHGIPKYIYLDNGKDYRCKDFAGGRKNHKLTVDEMKTTSMTAALGITAIFAWPYNAQSKSIERDFLRNKEWFSKHAPGYRGGNVVERPESLTKTIAAGKILRIEDLEKLLTVFISEILEESAVSSGYRAGKCPNEIWQKEYPVSIERQLVRQVSKQALMLFCTRTSAVCTIGRRGVRDSELGVDYYDDWMEGQKGIKVFLRRDPKAMEEAWVFNAATKSYIGQAYLLAEAAAIAKTNVQKEDLKNAIAMKRKATKLSKLMATTDGDLSMQEKMAAMALATKAINERRNYKTGETDTSNLSVQVTDMDLVAAKRLRNESDGLQDISILSNEIEAKKRKLFVWESERDEALQANE